MKILISLITLSLLGGCGGYHELTPSDYDHAFASCQPNGGLVEMHVTFKHYRAICVNGAEFYKAKGDK